MRIQSVHAPGRYPRDHVDAAVEREYVDTTRAFCDIASARMLQDYLPERLRPRGAEGGTR